MPACPHCGHEADPGTEACPLCGTPLTGTAAGQVPFEDPSVPFVRGLWDTWRESLFEPTQFFSRVTDEGSVARAILYFLVLTVLGAFFSMMWQSVWVSYLGTEGYAGAEGAVAGLALNFFLTPFFSLAGLLMAVLVYHLGAVMLAPQRQKTKATVRVVCYAAGPSLLGVVPLLGALVGGIWVIVLQVVGLREAHRSTTGRALLMVFWLPIVLFMLGIVAAILVGVLSSHGVTPGALVA